MSDFQDFLAHRFAHVTLGEFQAGKFEEAKQLYDEAVSTFTQGFKGAYLLQEQGNEQRDICDFWDSEESMKANITDEYRAVLTKMMPLFASLPNPTSYEVISEIRPAAE